jgi:hypothetical protein
MQLVVIIVGVVLVAAGLYFAMGGVGQAPSGGGYKSIKLEGPAWLLLVALGVTVVIFGAAWDWEGEETAEGPVTTTAAPTTTTTVELTTTTSSATTTTTTTTTPPGPCLPEPIVPLEGAVLDNGRLDRQDGVEWRFTWIECPDATQYQLVVLGPGATLPLIDETLTVARYDHHSEGSYIADTNRLGWTWRVRANIDGRWGEWVTTTFDVEPVDTD